MSKQDRQGVRKASDLERKYDFSLLGKASGGADSLKISQLEQELSQHIVTSDKKYKELDNHTSDSTSHVTQTEKNNISAAYLHSQQTSGNPHNVSKGDIGLGNVNNTADISKPVSTAQQSAIDKAYENANAYTDSKIAGLINGAPTTLDTLKEIADAMAENEDVVQALEESIGSKANQSELDSHTENSTIHITATERTNWNAAHTHSQKTSGNPHNVTKSDVGLGNVPNVATNDQTPTYTTASTLVNLVSGEKLSVSMGKIMKAITELIKHLANKSNPHGVTKAQVGLGNVDNTADASKKVLSATTLDGLTATVAELNHTDGVTSNIQTQLNAKVAKTTEYYGDMNSLVISGFYRVGTNTNLPTGFEYGQVIVSRGSDTAIQICCSYSTGKVITRGCNSPDSSPKWSEWVDYATKKDLENLEVGGGFDLSYANEALTFLSSSGNTSSWNLLADKTGTTGTITLPTAFNELHIVISRTSDNNNNYTFNILSNYLSSTARLFRNGWILSTSAFGDVNISISKTAINSWTFRHNGTVVEANIKVYYK